MGILNDIYNQTKLCDTKDDVKGDKSKTKDKESLNVSDKECVKK